ncbi:hypothetical protein BDZ89DRAFT_1040581 [Hymenopellis radicata]|nr:hypothetical protein BDZ89DRAFT_1040581 [Hymenopellis radicata]
MRLVNPASLLHTDITNTQRTGREWESPDHDDLMVNLEKKTQEPETNEPVKASKIEPECINAATDQEGRRVRRVSVIDCHTQIEPLHWRRRCLSGNSYTWGGQGALSRRMGRDRPKDRRALTAELGGERRGVEGLDRAPDERDPALEAKKRTGVVKLKPTKIHDDILLVIRGVIGNTRVEEKAGGDSGRVARRRNETDGGEASEADAWAFKSFSAERASSYHHHVHRPGHVCCSIRTARFSLPMMDCNQPPPQWTRAAWREGGSGFSVRKAGRSANSFYVDAKL